MTPKEPVSNWQAFWLVFLSVAGTSIVIALSGTGGGDWADVVATLLTGIGAVVGAFHLWKVQQRERARRLLTAGVTMFVGVHRNLLELKAFADYDTFGRFNRRISNRDDIYLGRDVHKKAVETFIDALIVNSNFATSNISALMQHAGDVDADKVDSFLRLAHLVNGLPAQLIRIRDEWTSADIANEPAELSYDHAFLVAYGIAASAYYLEKLGQPQGQSTAIYERIHAAQSALWEGQL